MGPREIGLACAALIALGAAREVGGTTLPEMLRRSDGAIVGRIESRSVREVDVGDGAPLYLTTLEVAGTDLASGEPQRVDVTFAGGFLDEKRGRYSASAPPADHTRVGREIIAFHRASNDLLGGVPGNALVGDRSGLFTTFRSRRGAVIVQGRGRGLAVDRNVTLTNLRERVQGLTRRK